jgi:glycosyltransferase involved in cell wall biosynthesis
MTVPLDALHVAALPFPSHQGTQAAIGAMLEALVEGGGHPSLLTYADGALEDVSPAFVHLRAPRLAVDRSLRSGPSLVKVLNDVGLAVATARHAPRFALVVAHHVEAALAARASRRPVLFVAHTALGPELPTYLAPRWGEGASRVGGAIDRLSIAGASAVAAISPMLAEGLASLGHRVVHTLPIPWRVATPLSEDERAHARRELGLPPSAQVVLYAGNLDGYQGLPVLFDALRDLPGVTLLVATEDAPARLSELPAWLARGTARLTSLRTEQARRQAHAAADLVALPRRSPGGLPVKLLDGLARGLPVAAVPRALAGHRGVPAVVAAVDDCPHALRAAITEVLSMDPQARRALGSEGPRYIAQHHSGAAFRGALTAAERDALGPPR